MRTREGTSRAPPAKTAREQRLLPPGETNYPLFPRMKAGHEKAAEAKGKGKGKGGGGKRVKVGPFVHAGGEESTCDL